MRIAVSLARRPVGAQRGFVLIELLVVLLVTGLLTATGLPQLRHFVDARAVEATVAAFRSALRLARSEAQARGAVVTVCALDPALLPAQLVCLDEGRDWSAGWMVFIDRDRRGRVDDGDLVLQIHQTGAGAPQVEGTQRYLSFQPTGISLTAASHLVYLPAWAPAGSLEAWGSLRLCINKPGRSRVLPAPETCG